jgi:hypothetical protein
LIIYTDLKYRVFKLSNAFHYWLSLRVSLAFIFT